MTRTWWILIRALKSLKDVHFDWSISCKVKKVWPKKKEKLTCGLENDMRNLAMFIRTLSKLVLSWYKMHELKLCRGFMCNDTEEWWKIWRKIELLFQNWHKEFGKFWLEHLSLENLQFWPKYIMFELKKYGGVIFHESREWCKIWRKIDLWFGKRHQEIGKISLEHTKVSKLGLLLVPYIQSRNCMSLKFTGELCVMTMKNYAKFEKELTSRFKTDMRNLINIDLSTQKFQKSAL